MPRNMLDVTVARVDSTPPAAAVAVEGGGMVRLWRERLETRAQVVFEDAESWPVLAAQGKVHYLGASGDDVLMQRVADRLITAAGLPLRELPEGVRCRSRGGFRVYFNYSATSQTVAAAGDEAEFFLGGPELPPAGVSVVRLATNG
jgi:beta-galactosidase